MTFSTSAVELSRALWCLYLALGHVTSTQPQHSWFPRRLVTHYPGQLEEPAAATRSFRRLQLDGHGSIGSAEASAPGTANTLSPWARSCKPR